MARPPRAPDLLLALASLAVLFLLIEAGFRVHADLPRERDVPFALHDTHLGYRLNPAHPDLNEHGFRDRPFPPPSETPRILVVGDSLGYTAEHTDDTWPAYLRRSLHEDLAVPDVEVLSAHVPGYTNYQELRWLELEGLALEPDLVVVGFVLNDLYYFVQRLRVVDGRVTDAFGPTAEVLGHAEGAAPGPPPDPPSLFLAWLAPRLSALAHRIRQWTLPGAGYAFEDRYAFGAAWREQPWRRVERQIAAMQRLGEREGFDLALVVFPVAAQYDPVHLERDRDHVLAPQRHLAEICARLSVPLLDLYPLLEPDRDLMRDGIHLEAAGRRRVGALVGRFLHDRGLVPRRVKPAS